MGDIKPQTQQIFIDEQMENFAGLYDALERVHRRLEMEGYTITDNEIIPPKNILTDKLQ